MSTSGRARLSFSLLVFATAPALVAVSCIVPALDLASKKCSSTQDCAGQTCNAAGACVATDGSVSTDGGGHESGPTGDALAPVDLCQTIPYFPGTQVVDGESSDFAGVPTESYPWGSLQTSNGVVGGSPLDVTAKVGWSAAGLHLFFHVHYESDGGSTQADTLVLPGASDPLWYGDALEIFVKGNSDCTGNFGATLDVGALHLVASPDPTNPPRSVTFESDGGEMTDPVPTADMAAHQDADGYDLEFLVPWPDVSAPDGSAPQASQRIALDFGVDYRDRSPEAGTSQPEYQLLLADRPVTSTTCPFMTALPPCDDRTWCTPALASP